MSDYRLYLIDADGRFFRRDDFPAPDDAGAIAMAHYRRGAHDAELWSGARLVKAFSTTGAGPAITGQAAE
jgi:hypothetical protein